MLVQREQTSNYTYILIHNSFSVVYRYRGLFFHILLFYRQPSISLHVTIIQSYRLPYNMSLRGSNTIWSFNSPNDHYLRHFHIFSFRNILIHVSWCTCARIPLGTWEGHYQVIRLKNVQYQNIKVSCFPKLLYQFKLPTLVSKRPSKTCPEPDSSRCVCIPVENVLSPNIGLSPMSTLAFY